MYASPTKASLRLVVAAFVAGLLPALMPAPASALGTVGAVDPTFNGGGPVFLDAARTVPRSTSLNGLLIDGQGRLVATGSTTDAKGKNATLVARFGAGGESDPAFGENGVRIEQLSSNPVSAYAPYSDAFSPFLVAGGVGFAVYRARSDGRPDQAAMILGDTGLPNLDFGSGGLLTFEPGVAPAYATASNASAGPDGSIYVNGVYESDPKTGANRKLSITKFTPQGGLAAGFGAGGNLLTSFSMSVTDTGTYGGPMRTLPGNKLLIAGTTLGADGRQAVYVARSNTLNGQPDLTFGTKAGATVIQARDTGGSDSQAHALAIAPDNSIYIGGLADDAQDRQAALIMRFSASGSPDPTFGAGGIKRIQVATGTESQDRSSIRQVIALPDGKVLGVGTTSQLDGSSVAFVLRLRSDGSLDPSFGASGIARLQFSKADPPSTGVGDAELSGSRIMLAGGVSDPGNTSRAFLASVLNEPLPDPPAPPAPVPAPSLAPQAAPAGRAGVLKLSGTKLRLGARRALAIRVSCSTAGRCAGNLRVASRTGKLTGPFKKRDRRATTYASVDYSLAAGRSTRLPAKLSKGAAARAKTGTLNVRFIIVPAAGASTVTNGSIRPRQRRSNVPLAR